MLFGIKTYDSKKMLKEYPKKVRKDLYETYADWFYFDNLKTALKVAKLKRDAYTKCKIYIVKKEKEQFIPRELIVSSVDEYLKLTTKRTYEGVENFKNMLKEQTK